MPPTMPLESSASTSPSTPAPTSGPTSGLVQTLQDIRRRVKLFSVAYGAGVVVAAAAGLLLATVLLDWLLNLPTPLRVIVVLAALGVFVYALVHWVVRPLTARLTIGDVAGRLEHTFPQFDDRLRSTVDFVREDGRYVPGSDPMKRRVVAEAGALAANVDLGQVIVLKPVYYSLAGGFAALLVLTLLAVLAGGDFLSIAANRLVGGSLRYPKSTQIAMLGTLPHRVPVGMPVDVKMKLSKGSARKAVVEYRYDNGPWQKELMNLGPDGTFAAALDARLRPDQNSGVLDIRVQAGDDELELPKVTLVPRLDVSRVEARVTPPPYAGQVVTAVNLTERPATMAVGSQVELRIEFNKPLQAAGNAQPVLLVPSKADQKAPRVEWKRDGDHVAVAHFQAAESMRFTVRATDVDGFENTAAQEYDLLVREDAMPTVQIEEPRRSEDRTPEAAFPLRVVAEDDYGITSAQLVVRRLNTGDAPAASNDGNQWVIDLVNGQQVAPNAAWQLADDRAEKKRFRLEYLWDLSPSLPNADLKAGEVLEYYVQVRDNFALNGRRHDYVSSGKLRITLISQEQFIKQVQGAFEQLHGELGQIKRGQTSTKVETEALAQQTKQRGKFEDADQKQADRLSNQQGTTAAQTKQTAGKLQDLVERMLQNKSQDKAMRDTAEEVGRQLEQAAEGPMKDASKELSTAKDQKTNPAATDAQKQQQNAQRDAALARAQQKQDQAASQLQQAMERLGNFGGLSEAIARIQAIKKAQDELASKFNKTMRDHLGKKPEDLDKKTQDELKKMAEDQKKLQAQTEQALTDMNKKGDQMQKSDPSASQAMKQAAKTGQEQAVPSKQQQASQAMRQNQQAQAQQAQKMAALGLEMILAKLREAERRKLEALAKQLEEMQKLVAELLRRQSGHNLDNLAIDNPKKLADMTEAERTELIELAERDANNPPAPPTVPQLSTSQEQTERNTRDVARSAEALPQQESAGTIAARLVAAAGQMERAIVHLRAGKLPDAYEPPQVEALRALAQAKEAVDEWKAKVDEQLQQQDRETIKQAYVKLLEAQKKLNKDTLDVDATPRGQDGALPRAVAVRLGQLPPEQGKLSETAEGLGKELEKIGSIVYVWANKDIVRSMNDVKDDLAKPDTGKVTQAEQTRIAEQLQSMIDNLVEKPRQSKFAGRGGGQCKGGVKMPTETELRLLKGLQEAVNKSTTTVEKQARDDAQKRVLVDLGGRQGELRGLLDQTMQKASEGKVKLGPEPDNRDQLPEEAGDKIAEAVEDQELQDFLIREEVKEGEGQDTIEKSVRLTGDRMARSRQRLALNNDPGQVTQVIQKRIIETLDQLIELSRQQQMQAQNPRQGQAKGQQQQKQLGQARVAQQQDGKQQGKQPGTQTGGQNPAQASALNQGGSRDADLTQQLQEKFSEWGSLTPREREAIIEGRSEQVIEKYRGLVEDYYRELGKKTKQE